MKAARFDTLDLFIKAKEVGFSEEQAKFLIHSVFEELMTIFIEKLEALKK